MADNTIEYGWQDQPGGGRGTFDILKTCAGTIFLLCWSSVCPNVPGKRWGCWAPFAQKLYLFLLSLLGPDFVFMVALGQLNAAWRAKEAFHKDGYASWTLRHCVSVNMGGLHVELLDRATDTRRTFPVDCEQLLHLVRHRHMALPEITKDEIDDRDKADKLARGIAVVQSLWFTFNSLGRAAQGLHLTTLELTTLSFVFIMTATSACW